MSMSMSRIFYKVKKHLLKQNAHSQAESMDTCAYRGDNGLKCAVGCLIPDKMYSYAMEEQGVDKDIVTKALVSVLGVNVCKREEKIRLLRDLQYTHDTFPPVDWPDRLAVIQTGYNIA